jgi:hypothetical protein
MSNSRRAGNRGVSECRVFDFVGKVRSPVKANGVPLERRGTSDGHIHGSMGIGSNNDSIFGVIDSINDGKSKAGHDNLQQSNVTWTHSFNEKGTFLTTTEAYYIYQSHALVGGIVNNGPPHSWLEGVGPGAPHCGQRSGDRNR